MNTDVLFEDPLLGDMTLRLLRKRGIDDRIRRYISYMRPEGSKNMGYFTLLTPYVLRSGDESRITGRMESENPESIMVRNIETLGLIKERGYRGSIISDAPLYTFNRLAVQALREQGVSEFTVPFELNIHEIRERGCEASVIVIYGRTPLMVSAQCTYRTVSGKCLKKPGGFMNELRDRKNTDFPVRAECDFCYNIIYNSVPLCLFTEMDEIMRLGPEAVRLDFTDESPEEAADLIEAVVMYFEGKTAAPDGRVTAYTKGHFRKGVE